MIDLFLQLIILIVFYLKNHIDIIVILFVDDFQFVKQEYYQEKNLHVLYNNHEMNLDQPNKYLGFFYYHLLNQ
jgi:hypothetical protein